MDREVGDTPLTRLCIGGFNELMVESRAIPVPHKGDSSKTSLY